MDNFFKTCPPLMSDGRHFTDYRTPTRRNEAIRYYNEILRDDDYRYFLQTNGEQIMDNEWKYFSNKMCCRENPCVFNYPTRTIPQWMVRERIANDRILDPTRPRISYNATCENFCDYRMVTTDSVMQNISQGKCIN